MYSTQELMMDISYCRQLLQDILSSPPDGSRRVVPVRDIRSPWVRRLLVVVGFLPDDRTALVLTNDGEGGGEREGGEGGREGREEGSWQAGRMCPNQTTFCISGLNSWQHLQKKFCLLSQFCKGRL